MRDRTRPVEFLGIALIVALFIGLVVLGSTRQPTLALIFFGVTFIVTLVTIAMLALAVKPGVAEKKDISDQNDEQKLDGHGPDGRSSGH
ncbi:MAG: hypothetical protein JWO10_1831 [Microbacteriaceae bacterium]|nr:hypothetical protein [Microbacteriaceae bacterium]